MTICKEIEAYAKSFERKMKIEKKSKNTIEAYMRTYKHFVDFCNQYDKELSFKNIKEDDIYAFLDYKSENMNKQGELSVSSANSYVVHLKRLFNYIERNGDELYDFDRVFEDIKLKQPQRKPKGLSDEAVEKILKYLEVLKCEETFIAFRNSLLFKVMLLGGLRASEAVTLTLSCFKEEEDFYKISFKGKGDKNRVSYVKKEAIEDELLTLKDTFFLGENEKISRTSSGNCMDRVQLSKMVNSIYKRAGVKASGVHILRHTAAKTLLGKGVSIVVVQSLLGHNSIQTTSIYANPTDDIVKRELAGMTK